MHEKHKDGGHQIKHTERGPKHGGHERLRDWDCPSYNEEGRYTTLGGHEHGASNEMPHGHGNGMREQGGPDKARRNK